jgi:tetratricopeptide (TPR) repeat protein
MRIRDPALQEEPRSGSVTLFLAIRIFLAHATLSVYVPLAISNSILQKWLEKAEFHCRRAIELDPDLAEARVAHAFLLWGPSKNFQHLEAIAELRRALVLQKNLPHAYNRLGTILAHVGLLDHARAMYERARQFHPRKQISHSILQVYMWNAEHEAAREEISAWREESPTNKYPIYFAPQLAMMTGDWKRAKALLEQAARQLPEEPMIVSLLGLYHALRGKSAKAMYCLARACSTAKSFGHAHHTYYQVACILALEKRIGIRNGSNAASAPVSRWPFFLKDPCSKPARASNSTC